MKTAISVQDKLFKRVEKYTRKEKISRSQFFSDAAQEYLDRRESEDLIANLNEVYGKEKAELDPVLLKMALLSLPKEEW